MVVRLVLTEGMIEDFHMCARVKDYQRFFEDYPTFFGLLAQHVKKVKFECVNPRQIIAENLKLFLDILRDWSEGRFSLSCDEIYQVEMDFPNFKRRNFHYFTNPPSMKPTLIKDWNKFYIRYLPVIDGMIREARDQEIIDLKIECKAKFFDDFGSRDDFLRSCGTQWEPQAAPRSSLHTNNAESSVKKYVVPKIYWGETMEEENENELILDAISELEEYSYSITDHDSDYTSQKTEHFESPVPPTDPQPLNDYKEKLARLETDFQKRFQAQEEEIEGFEAQSRILKENSEIYIQQVESRIQEQLKLQEEQIASRENQLKRREDDMDRKVDEIRRREENMDRKMGEMMEMMKMMVRNAAATGSGNLVSENPISQISGPVQANTVNTPDSGISDNNNDFERKNFEVHGFAQSLVPAVSADSESKGMSETGRFIQQKEEELPKSLDITQDQDTSSSLNHIQNNIEEQEHNQVDELEKILEEEEESDDNDSLRQMEEEFQRALAEQRRVHEEELRRVQERREINRETEEAMRLMRNGL